VVGISSHRAFIYTDGVMYDHNDLISYDNPFFLQLGFVSLSEAIAINNKGQIACQGFSYSVLSGFKPNPSFFLLTPVPRSPFEDVNERFAVSVRILLGIIGRRWCDYSPRRWAGARAPSRTVL
jgi:hypothetical protein